VEVKLGELCAKLIEGVAHVDGEDAQHPLISAIMVVVEAIGSIWSLDTMRDYSFLGVS
jgi:hypothetical protein